MARACELCPQVRAGRWWQLGHERGREALVWAWGGAGVSMQRWRKGLTLRRVFPDS